MLMKSLIFTLILTISVAVSPCYAKLGDTESEAIASHPNATSVNKHVIDEHMTVIEFTEKDSESVMFLLDGKVQGETNVTPDFKQWFRDQIQKHSKKDTKTYL